MVLSEMPVYLNLILNNFLFQVDTYLDETLRNLFTMSQSSQYPDLKGKYHLRETIGSGKFKQKIQQYNI